MKFDFVIGNPPYQLETEIKSETNGQARRKSIFQYFQSEADKIAKESSVLIYPGGRWIQRSGKGMASFGLQQINDPNLHEILFFPDSHEVFRDAAIPDGISIVVKKTNRDIDGFDYIYCQEGNESRFHLANPGENIIPLNPLDIEIVAKVDKLFAEGTVAPLHGRVHPQKLFAIESEFVQMNSSSVREYVNDDDVDFKNEVKLYANDKAGKAGRTKWFVTKRATITTNAEFIDKWKVVVSSANAGGQKRDNQLELIDNHSAFGRSRVALGSFSTKREAENFFAYVSSYVIRFLFLMTDESLTTLALKVPDIGDYSDENTFISFNSDIDAQLCSLLSLSGDEYEYICKTVQNLRKGAK